MARDACWSVLPDHRTADQRAVDATIEAEVCDEPDELERLRVDLVALADEYGQRRAARGDAVVEPCPLCGHPPEA